jgi:hypothetical protein
MGLQLLAEKIAGLANRNRGWAALSDENIRVLSLNQRSCYVLSKEFASLGAGCVGPSQCGDGRVRLSWPSRPADRVPDHRNPSGDRNDRIFRILPDVRMQETLWPLTTGYIV